MRRERNGLAELPNWEMDPLGTICILYTISLITTNSCISENKIWYPTISSTFLTILSFGRLNRIRGNSSAEIGQRWWYGDTVLLWDPSKLQTSMYPYAIIRQHRYNTFFYPQTLIPKITTATMYLPKDEYENVHWEMVSRTYYHSEVFMVFMQIISSQCPQNGM